MKLTATGTLLTASADDRTLTYRLLPFGEPGSTNLGKVTASAGTVTIPTDPSTVHLNLEHEFTRPVGKAVNITEDDAGLAAAFRIARTTAGDDLLAEAEEGLRAGVSVELDNVIIRDGRLVAADLTGAGAVVRPAFPSAQLVAADAGDLPADDEDEDTTDALDTEDTTEGDEPENQEEDTMGDTTATVPAGSLAARSGKTMKAAAESTGAGDLFRMLAGAQTDRQMLAALSDIVPANVLGLEQPQYVGELWGKRAYERKIIPLFNHADLTSFTVRGWRWVTKPAVAPYLGNKTDVPSNAIATEQIDITAERIAGAHDIDRKFRDFNDTAFFEAYFAAMTESYAKVSDAQVLADVLAAATPVTRGTVPTDVPAGLVSVVDGALSILNETDVVPTFAIVATDLWRDIILTPKDKTLEYLSSGMGLEGGSAAGFRLIPSAALAAGSTLVGVSSAVTVHELGGPAPIRVEALDIARGGVDEGVFGYYAVNVHETDGLALVTAGV